MGVIINIIFFGISFITLAVAGGFATNSAVRFKGIPNWESNDDLKTAHKYLTIAAVVTWITVAVILLLGILYVVFVGSETMGTGMGIVIYGLMFLALGATIAVGILSAIAAQKISDSKVTKDNNARRQAIIAAVLALVSAAGLIIGLIVMFFKPKKEEKKDEGGLFEGLGPAAFAKFAE